MSLVVDRRCSQHERAERRFGGDHAVNYPCREATELARAYVYAFAVDFDDDRAFQNHEDFVAIPMGVRLRIGPAGVGVVEPNLQSIGLPRNGTPWLATSEQR